MWKEGPGQPVALACLRDRRYGGTAIVGYEDSSATPCVTPYIHRLIGSTEILCEVGGTPWTVQCEGDPGCIHYFMHEPDFTELDGPLEAQARGIRVFIDGRPFEGGVVVAHVEGRLEHSIGAREPFGYFAIFVDRCVVPDQVKIEFLGAGGSLLGETRGWDVVVPPCKGEGRNS